MKDFLNLNGLSYFVDKLFENFSIIGHKHEKSDIVGLDTGSLTNADIDAICGATFSDDLVENTLVDIATGIAYRVYVENGKLSMAEVE